MLVRLLTRARFIAVLLACVIAAVSVTTSAASEMMSGAPTSGVADEMPCPRHVGEMVPLPENAAGEHGRDASTLGLSKHAAAAACAGFCCALCFPLDLPGVPATPDSVDRPDWAPTANMRGLGGELQDPPPRAVV